MKHTKSIPRQEREESCANRNPQNRGTKRYQTFGRLFTMMLTILLLQGNFELNAQDCNGWVTTPPVPVLGGMALDTIDTTLPPDGIGDIVDVNGDGIIDTGDGAFIDLSATACGDVNNTYNVQSGGTYGFALSAHNSYKFTLCPDGHTMSGNFDIYEAGNPASPVPYEPFFGTTITGYYASGPVDATTGCVSYNYVPTASGMADPDMDCIAEVLFTPFTHSCLPDWKDWILTVDCGECEIVASGHVGAQANANNCMTGTVSVPYPTIGGDDCATCGNIINFALCDADGNPMMPAVTGMIDITMSGPLVLPPLPPGEFILKWTIPSPCDPAIAIATAETDVVVDVVMACNDNINVTLGIGCWVQITPDMILEAPCDDLDVMGNPNFGMTIDGVPTDIISDVGVYTVSVTYLATGVSCWGTVTVEDKTGPSCSLPLSQRFHSITCGNEDPSRPPTFGDCTGVATTNCVEEIYGDCGEMGLLVNGVIVPSDGDGSLAGDLCAPLGGLTSLVAADGTIIPIPNMGAHPDAFKAFDAYKNTIDPCSGMPAFLLDHVIVRYCTATDVLGYVANGCRQFVFVWRPAPDAIYAPATPTVVECGDATDMATLAEDNPTSAPYYFDLDEDCLATVPVALDRNHGCKYSIVATDTPLDDLCGNTEKFIRKWTVLDWCTGAIIDAHTVDAAGACLSTVPMNGFPQIIKTVDTTAPEFTDCPTETNAIAAVTVGGTYENPIVINTSSSNPNSCYFYGLLNSPTATDDCSSPITYGAVVNSLISATSTGTLVSSVPDLSAGVQLPTGHYKVTFTATDECGNADTCDVYYEVLDDDQPVAICDEHTVVSLTNNGTAQVCATNLDSGSYDNCGVVTRQVRRMDADEAVPFTDCIEVTCADATIMVVLRVYDAAGNHNDCMVEVEVQDKIPPILTCAPDVTINCGDDHTDLTLTGQPSVVGNCSTYSVDYQDSGVEDLNCGTGTFVRKWFVVGQPDVSCNQWITVSPGTPFTVAFPGDVTIDDCVSPGNLGDHGAPVITNENCATVGVSSTDQQFNIVQGACYKILRTWTVIDWCTYDDTATTNTDLGTVASGANTYDDDGDGFFQYTQVIKVIDNTPPVINNCPTGVYQVGNGGINTCTGIMDYQIDATDACTPISEMIFTWAVDIDSNGTIDVTGNGNVVHSSNNFASGTHTAYYTVADGCGNASECTIVFEVKDDQKPNITCHQLSTELNPATATVGLWASDFIEFSGTSDNCTSNDNLIYTIRRANSSEPSPPTTSNITFTCDDLMYDASTGQFNPTPVTVEVWVTDEAGNQDYCLTYTFVTDNMNACTPPDGDDNSVAASIAGRIYDEFGADVESVDVDIASTTTNSWNPFVTNNSGTYNFGSLPMYDDYTITPEKDINPLNGVSTLDLVLISKHILGTEPLNTPYKVIAADVNNDGNVSTFDVVQLRQLILFIITDFPSNTSWRFVDATYNFPNPLQPWSPAYPEIRSVTDLTANMMAEDFVGVKIGDVSGNAIPNSLLGTEDRNTIGNLTFTTDDRIIAAGEQITIPFNATELDKIIGYQFTMNFDNEALKFVSTGSGSFAVNENNFGMGLLSEGVITTSWTKSADETADKGRLFSLTFTAKEDVQLSEAISFNSRYTKAEAYSEDLDLMEVTLQFNNTNGTVAADANFDLYQNRPNPFNNETTIGFNLPTASTTKLTIYDMSGRTLKVIEGDYERGYNEITVNNEDLTGGVLYYQLDTPTNSATKKMIVVE